MTDVRECDPKSQNSLDSRLCCWRKIAAGANEVTALPHNIPIKQWLALGAANE
jgi:hypothetical protein